MIAFLKIKKVLLFAIIFGLIFTINSFGQTTFISKNVKISLFSSTPLEDIKAQSAQAYSVLIPKTKEIVFQLGVKSLAFARPLMQEHFNENYIESDKYPNALFKGTIVEDIDFKKEGTQKVTAVGAFTVHGVTKQRTITGKLTIVNSKPTITCGFDVLCADHKIKIPKLVFTKIAENITITVNANYN